MTPFFSVIIPVHNRERLVGRALRSCLAQDHASWEALVVDDGSSDATAKRVQSFDDPRIRLLRHFRNQGQGPARNTGMAAAAGLWFVFLDSDDELLPTALDRIRTRITESPTDVVALRFMCQDDSGRTSPDPPHRDELWDYSDFLRWLELLRGRPSEAMPCVRADTFPHVRYSAGHAEEALYHLDVARCGRVRACSDVVRLYHDDADNRLTSPDARRALRYAPDAARDARLVLERHGEALGRWAPAVRRDRLRAAAVWSLLAGDRAGGYRYAREYLGVAGGSATTFAWLAAGLIHPGLLGWLRAAGGRLRAPAKRRSLERWWRSHRE